MKLVKLIPLNNKAKQKLSAANYPDHWVVGEEKEMVGFSDREGPWLKVYPDTNSASDHTRWVHAVDDRDFRVVEV